MPRFCRPYVFIPQRCAARAEQGGTAPSQPQQMPQCGHGVMPQHARPGIAHDAAHPLAHLGTVTMNGTVLAVGLPLTMRAARKTQHGIVKQFVTRRAQFLVPLGMAAIEADHLRHRALLAADARRIAAPASRHCIFRFSPHANSVTTSSFLLHTLRYHRIPAGKTSTPTRKPRNLGHKDTHFVPSDGQPPRKSCHYDCSERTADRFSSLADSFTGAAVATFSSPARSNA